MLYEVITRRSDKYPTSRRTLPQRRTFLPTHDIRCLLRPLRRSDRPYSRRRTLPQRRTLPLTHDIRYLLPLEHVITSYSIHYTKLYDIDDPVEAKDGWVAYELKGRHIRQALDYACSADLSALKVGMSTPACIHTPNGMRNNFV